MLRYLHLVLKYSLILILAWVSIASIGGCTSENRISNVTENPGSKSIRVTTVPDGSPLKTGTINLRFVDQYSPEMLDAKNDEELGSLITQLTGGSVTITYFHNNFSQPGDFLNLVNLGACDIVNITPGAYPEQFPMEIGVELPGLGLTDPSQRLEIMWQLLDQGYFAGLSHYKVLSFNPTRIMNFYFTRPIETVEDMKGLRMRVSAKPIQDLIGKLGAIPTFIATPEVYMSLQRGILDGLYTASDQVSQYQYYRYIQYCISNPISQGSMFVIMSPKVWESLPAADQVGIDQAIREYRSVYIARLQDNESKVVQSLQQNGITYTTFSPADMDLILEAAAYSKYDFMQAQGAKGQAMLDEVERQIFAK